MNKGREEGKQSMPRKQSVIECSGEQEQRMIKKIVEDLESQVRGLKPYSVGCREPWKVCEQDSGILRPVLSENQCGRGVESELYRRTH